ncbi:MAG TPA: LUD domain-containing protein [Acidocella sp.]|nr:LUD domain-containing protein [Acidocella sp.]
MSSRDDILARLRANRPQGRHDLPVVPDFTKPPAEGLEQKFRAMLELAGGKILEPDGSGDLLAPLRARLAASPAVCSAVPDVQGQIDLSTVALPRDLAGVDIAVVRAAFAVAETGSILVSEEELHINALGYLAQHLIVLVDPAQIVTGIQHAYMQPHFHNARYACFQTGPSATADIEGVLIRGAQGVRSLTVAFVPRGYVSPAA